MSVSPVQHWDLGIGPISCHCWNKDKTQLAVSASNNVIYIFEKPPSSGPWKQLHRLEEHDLLVTSIDWAPNSNRIVSCSHDKNAFVWTFVGGVWKPELVLVRSNRAATCVKWSPMENKFAVATGARLVAVCYYEKENDWWISKQIKKPLRSTATSLDWHPGNVLLAVGSCDFKARVFSAFVKEIDDKPSPNPWGAKMPFGALLAEYISSGWIHDVAFSPSGCRLMWVAHDSTVALVDKADSNNSSNSASNGGGGSGGEPILHKSTHLPFTCLQWLSEGTAIAAGHDCSPVLFSVGAGGELKMVSKLDVPADQNKGAGVNSALKIFRNLDRNAATDGVGVLQLKTLHQNAIVQVQPYAGRPDGISKFSTCGIDGLVALWDLQVRNNGEGKGH